MPDLRPLVLRPLLLAAAFCVLTFSGAAAVRPGDRCAICGALFTDKVYIATDRVTEEKKEICPDCINLPNTCFRCGLPVKKDYTELPDGRVLCARDVKNAVLDEDEARQLISGVVYTIDRLLSRFTSFPSTNVQTTVVDRVNLQAILAMPGGHDYVCPNVLGYTQSSTNNGKISHKISIMSGLARAEVKAVCAHELSHAWVAENLSAERRRTLGSDAHEGFCELIAFLLMDSQGDEDEKKVILANRYTRGQIDLFIEAEHKYGLNEIIEWMKYGQDAVLHREDLNRIRTLRQAPERKPATFAAAMAIPGAAARPLPATSPSTIVLKGVSWSQTRPLCVINDHTFEVNEQGQIRVGGTNLLIQCVAIRQNGARIRLVNSGQEKELAFDKR